MIRYYTKFLMYTVSLLIAGLSIRAIYNAGAIYASFNLFIPKLIELSHENKKIPGTAPLVCNLSGADVVDPHKVIDRCWREAAAFLPPTVPAAITAPRIVPDLDRVAATRSVFHDRAQRAIQSGRPADAVEWSLALYSLAAGLLAFDNGRFYITTERASSAIDILNCAGNDLLEALHARGFPSSDIRSRLKQRLEELPVLFPVTARLVRTIRLIPPSVLEEINRKGRTLPIELSQQQLDDSIEKLLPDYRLFLGSFHSIKATSAPVERKYGIEKGSPSLSGILLIILNGADAVADLSAAAIYPDGLDRLFRRECRALALVRGIYTALAVTAFHETNGRWPLELRETAPCWLRTAFINPLDGKFFDYGLEGVNPSLKASGAGCSIHFLPVPPPVAGPSSPGGTVSCQRPSTPSGAGPCSSLR